MEKKPFKTGDAPADVPVFPFDSIDEWTEPEIGLLVHGLFNLSIHHTAANYSVYGTLPMLASVLLNGPYAETLSKHLDYSIQKIESGEIPLTPAPTKVVPRLAYVVKDLGVGNGVRIETVHGTSGFTVPEDSIERDTVPTPLAMIYHVPYGVFIFDSVVRIGYNHDLAIFFAEEHVRLLNHPFVKAWGVFHKSNPLLRVRN